jgi:Subtilase family
MRKPTAAFLQCGLLVLLSTARPSGSANAGELYVTVQLVPSVARDCYAEIAKIARPRLLQMPPGLSVREFVKNNYGRDDAELVAFIAAYQRSPSGFPGFVLAPEIGLRIVRGARLSLLKGATVAPTVGLLLGTQGKATLGKVAAVNERSMASLDDIAVGERLKIPDRSTARTILLAPGVEPAQAAAVLKRCGSGVVRWSVHGPTSLAVLDDNVVQDLTLPGTLLPLARQALERFPGGTVGDIAVVDSGTPADTPVRLWHNPDELGGIAGADDDSNGFVDDVFGVNLIEPDLRPIDDSADSHGGLVALIASGLIYAALPAEGTAEVLPIKVASSKTVDMQAVDNGVIYAELAGAVVVNLSLEGPLYFAEREVITAASSRMLIVAAAGNGELVGGIRKGVDLESHRIYPALLGGENSPGVITVGSLGATSNTLAEYSNYSPLRVDLAAPGATGPPANQRGTSFSAALVSWAAGRLKLAGLRTPRQIKTRLISACTAVEALRSKVNLGCVLDLRKLFWVDLDVLETSGGEILVGDVLDKEGISVWTDHGERPLRAIRKIVVAADSSWALLGSAGSLRQERLKGEPPSLRFQLRSGEVRSVEGGAWIDLVPAYQ